MCDYSVFDAVLQGKLSDMNIALDSTNSNVNRQQMIQEAMVFRERNEQMQQQLENAFSERQAKDAINKRLEEDIEMERNKMNKVIEEMDPVDQEKYRQYDQLAKKLSDENNQMHEEINTMLNRKTILETMIKISPERIEAVRMQSKLNEMKMNLMTAKEVEQHRLTPAQEREKLIIDVRVNKQALTSIQHQIKIAEDTLTEKRELVKQLDDDLDENSSERYAKYKELKHRDEIMSKFMDNFKENLSDERKSKFSFKYTNVTGISVYLKQNLILFRNRINKNPNNLGHRTSDNEWCEFEVFGFIFG